MGSCQSKGVANGAVVPDFAPCPTGNLNRLKGTVVEQLLLVPFSPSCGSDDPVLQFLYSWVLEDPFVTHFDTTGSRSPLGATDRFPTLQAFHDHLRASATQSSTPFVMMRVHNEAIHPTTHAVTYGSVKALLRLCPSDFSMAGYYHSTQSQDHHQPTLSVELWLARSFCNGARSCALLHFVSFICRRQDPTAAPPATVQMTLRQSNLPLLRLLGSLYTWHVLPLMSPEQAATMIDVSPLAATGPAPVGEGEGVLRLTLHHPELLPKLLDSVASACTTTRPTGLTKGSSAAASLTEIPAAPRKSKSRPKLSPHDTETPFNGLISKAKAGWIVPEPWAASTAGSTTPGRRGSISTNASCAGLSPATSASDSLDCNLPPSLLESHDPTVANPHILAPLGQQRQHTELFALHQGTPIHVWSEDTWIPCWWGDATEGWLLKRTKSQAHLESGKLTLRLVPSQQPPTAPLPLWGEDEPLGLAYSSQLIVAIPVDTPTVLPAWSK